jgi:polysaccharide export outer membrane protein
MRIWRRLSRVALLASLCALFGACPNARARVVQNRPESAPVQPGSTAAQPPADAGVTLPIGYTIGADDVLTVVFWRDKDMSSEVVVRPDGKISLPLINEVDAVGLTPDQLRVKLQAAASNFIEEPNATVVVKQINSRKVFITGEVAKPGPYVITGPTTVLQLIAMAGGLHEFADRERIVILRVEKGRQVSYRFNYKEVSKGKSLAQNLELRPGDTVLVP